MWYLDVFARPSCAVCCIPEYASRIINDSDCGWLANPLPRAGEEDRIGADGSPALVEGMVLRSINGEPVSTLVQADTARSRWAAASLLRGSSGSAECFEYRMVFSVWV
jgi:hypothetical protein